jgi:hypothetical protein
MVGKYVRITSNEKRNGVNLIDPALMGKIFLVTDSYLMEDCITIDPRGLVDSKTYDLYTDEYEEVDEVEAMKQAFEIVFNKEPEYETELEEVKDGSERKDAVIDQLEDHIQQLVEEIALLGGNV